MLNKKTLKYFETVLDNPEAPVIIGVYEYTGNNFLVTNTSIFKLIQLPNAFRVVDSRHEGNVSMLIWQMSSLGTKGLGITLRAKSFVYKYNGETWDMTTFPFEQGTVNVCKKHLISIFDLITCIYGKGTSIHLKLSECGKYVLIFVGTDHIATIKGHE